MIDSESIIKNLEKKLSNFTQDPKSQNVGWVQSNTDGVIQVSGLTKAFMGEIITFEDGSTGFVLNLDEDRASVILLNGGKQVREGEEVKRTEKLLTIKASDELLGRVVDVLGNPLDGKDKIKSGKEMPLEKIAAGVIDRKPVDTPLKTGITAIDSMFPIGRGQRELIIGDRGLGKTAIVIDTIINQRSQPKNRKRVICIYVAIGQKRASVAQVIERLKIEGAMEYSIVVVADASDPASMQYLAPYAGTAIAEYFLEKGEDVLIIYDDLTKHAWSYRQLSLVLRRPAGREAYPGDIFYLHSRLLERSVRLNDNLGGGSITALPIIETQANDISAYIPTNVISITDGQIFLEADLFNSGIRPAINTGNSVSRVGGAALTGAMKSVAGKMRLDLAQYRELAVFAQFGSELDANTQAQLERGKRITEILKQSQYQPLSEGIEIINICVANSGAIDSIAPEKVLKFIKEYDVYVQKHNKKLVETLGNGEKVSPETLALIKKSAEDFRKKVLPVNMATKLTLRRRIKTTQNVSKTTRAMQMIAASKLKRAQQSTLSARPYVTKMSDVVQSITQKVEKPLPAYMVKRHSQNGKRLILAISSDKGLSGSLNTNLSKELLLQANSKDVFITVGKKITSTINSLYGNQVIASYNFGNTSPRYESVYPIIDIINTQYLERKVDKVDILSSHFESVFSQKPHMTPLLPIIPNDDAKNDKSMQSLYLFEPEIESILPDLLNRYITMIIYHEMLETFLSQQAAQMIAMQNATNNAKDMIEDLTLEYNKIRQAEITNQLLDISGASAL